MLFLFIASSALIQSRATLNRRLSSFLHVIPVRIIALWLDEAKLVWMYFRNININTGAGIFVFGPPKFCITWFCITRFSRSNSKLLNVWWHLHCFNLSSFHIYLHTWSYLNSQSLLFFLHFWYTMVCNGLLSVVCLSKQFGSIVRFFWPVLSTYVIMSLCLS